MYRKRMVVLSFSLFAPLLLGLLLFDAVSAWRTTNGPPAAPIVDTLADKNDGSCEDGDCSLREAIIAATAGETITFNVTGTIVLSPALGFLTFYKDLTIDGGGVITVSGDNAMPVFKVTTSNVTFDSLTIANGREEYSRGGGIYNNEGTVTVTNSTLSGNWANVSGGGIFNQGTLMVSNSTLTGNSAENGGGIFSSEGTVTVTNSTLSGNSTTDHGGGIFNYEGTVTVSNSTLSGNSAANDGGGIFNQGTVTVINSTLSGNSADSGGGIFSRNTTMINNSTLSGNSANFGAGIYNNDTTVTVSNSTVSDNRAMTSGGGGGIASVGLGTTSTIITNTIVSGNVISGTTTDDDLMLFTGPANSYTSGGYNLIGAISAEITSITATGDITNTLPLLSPLADHGGDTFTHALLPGSPAFNAGGNCGVAADQRGIARPQGSACDTGAFEVQPINLTVLLAGTGSGSANSLPSGFNCSGDTGLYCTKDYWEGVAVTLTATTAAGSSFSGWSGGGCGGSGNCVLSMTESKNVTATFALNQYELSVTVDGTGSGTVSSSPVGISCGGDCSESYGAGTVVTLTATTAADSSFNGWSGGGCSGSGSCVLSMTESKNVTATFTLNQYELSVTVDGTGSGTVSSSPVGISCGGDCSESYGAGTAVTLTATTAADSSFNGWSGGGCSGSGSCVLSMTESKNVTATFTLNQYELSVTVDGTGSGTVSSSPVGISCGGDCSESYSAGTVVTLTAAAGAGSEFMGWSGGGCSGDAACEVTMDGAKTVTASFKVSLFTVFLPVVIK